MYSDLLALKIRLRFRIQREDERVVDPLPSQRRYHILDEVCVSAIGKCHQQCVVHRNM